MTKNFTTGTSRIKTKTKKDKQKLLIWNQNGQATEASMKIFIAEGVIK